MPLRPIFPAVPPEAFCPQVSPTYHSISEPSTSMARLSAVMPSLCFPSVTTFPR